MNNVFLAFGLTLIAGLSTGIGSCIAFLQNIPTESFCPLVLDFLQVFMIYVSMIEIFVKAQDSFGI